MHRFFIKRLAYFTLTLIIVLSFFSGCDRFNSSTNYNSSSNGNANQQQRTLNLLCWAGYEEPQFLGEFEKKYNVKVNYKTFFGGDGMLTLLNQSPGQYDVIVVDKDYLSKLYSTNKIKELNPSDFDYSDYFEPFKKSYGWIDGKLYGVVVEFGTSALVYNTKYLKPEDVKSYKILWDPKVKGKVGIWDWYLPNMGNFSQSLGNKKPFELNDQELDQLKVKMDELRPQIKAFHSSPTEILTALSNEETWIIPGSGEWLASILKQQGKPIDWVIPEEGGLMWVDTLVIPKDAPNPDVAKLYIQWLMTPEAQALLSQKQAFNSNVPNKKAYDILTDSQKDILKIRNEPDVTAFVNKMSDRNLPINQSEKVWQDAWGNFKTKK